MAGQIGVGAYVLGMAGLGGAVAAVAWGAVAVRPLVVPTWSGARARLAEVVVFLSVVLAVAQLLGAVHLLRAPIVAGVEIAAGLGLVAGARWWGARHPPRPGDDPDPAGPEDQPVAATRRWEWGLATACLAVVGVQWLAHTVDAVDRGMPHPDTHWYHGPFVARFVQAGGFPNLDGVGYEAARWFPFDAHLAQVLVVLPHHRDWISPFLNLGWAVLALLAVWCIGERRAAGPVALAVAAVGLGLPILAATQPGQLSTDIACAALLLTAVALLLEGDLAPGPVALAGAAAGLGIGTKVTIAVPVALLAVAVALLLATRRRWGALGWWVGALATTGSFWFVRNWILSGSPLPWFDVPVLFDQVVAGGDDLTLVTARFDRQEWDAVYHPGLRQGFGPAWPAVVVLLGLGVAVVARGRGVLERLVGVAIVAGVAGYAVSPATAGVGFVFNLRYLGVFVLLSAAVLPLVLPARPAVRLGTGAVALALVVVGATAAHEERTPAWPATTWVALLAAVVGVLVVGAAVVAVHRGHVRPAPLVAVGIVGLLVVGWPVERISSARRYVDAGLPTSDVINTAMRDVRDADVVVYGTAETYPMFGLDLSNHVELGTTPSEEPATCAAWRRHLGGRYDYVAVAVFGLVPLPRPADADLATDPAVTVVARDGESALYRLDGPLDPTLCP